MRRPTLPGPGEGRGRDYTDNYLRRIARALGYKGKYLALAISDVLVHPDRPGESELLQYPNETRREAAARLQAWRNKQ